MRTVILQANPNLAQTHNKQGRFMKLYELTDKGRALLAKPRHPEPTNWEHCCSCCNVLDKENKELKEQLNGQ